MPSKKVVTPRWSSRRPRGRYRRQVEDAVVREAEAHHPEAASLWDARTNSKLRLHGVNIRRTMLSKNECDSEKELTLPTWAERKVVTVARMVAMTIT